MMGVTLTGSILLSLSSAPIVNRGHTNSWNEHLGKKVFCFENVNPHIKFNVLSDVMSALN